jgi:cold shock CspA family protein
LTHGVGVVDWFDVNKGYGFLKIIRDGEPISVFAHRSSVLGEGYRYLIAGEPVVTDYVPNADEPGKWTARSVRSADGRRSGTVKSFDYERGFGLVVDDESGDEVFAHWREVLSSGQRRAELEAGEEVQFDLVVAPDGRFKAERIKRLDDRLPLYRFAQMSNKPGDDSTWLESLAELAEDEPETWSYRHMPTTESHPVLRSYAIYTFQRLRMEAKIAYGEKEGRKYASFNTGLVTPGQDEIYALFREQNPRLTGNAWRLQGFYVGNDRAILGVFQQLPEMANYFEEPAELLYDRRCSLEMDIEHIVRERLERFPEQLRDNPTLARAALTSAKDRARARVKRNYKTAIPVYYRGHIQLLLPLCLLNPDKANLALVVSRHGNQYRGETVLTLDMAYNNARLLTRPDREWLSP